MEILFRRKWVITNVEVMFLLDVLFVKSRNTERKDSVIQLEMHAHGQSDSCKLSIDSLLLKCLCFS